jgi:hypothetical protein
MRKIFLILLSGVAIAGVLAGPANAITMVPPTANLGTEAITLGTEVYVPFVNSGDTIELTFYVPVGAGGTVTEYLNLSPLDPTGGTLNVDNFSSQGTYIGSSSDLTPPISLSYSTIALDVSYDVYVTWNGTTDPNLGVELTASSLTLPAPSATPLPAAFPMFAGGLGLIGLLARRKKRKVATIAAT